MTVEGLANIYPVGLVPLYPGATDHFLTDIPVVDTFNSVGEIVKQPAALGQRLERALEAFRTIETSRQLIAYQGSTCLRLVQEHPGIVANLPADVRAQVEELASRMKAD
ncbi:MAG TPA: hypothetical protein VLG37_02210 [Candidatus Saccharimonadales bacterium]|nr:hypothetical protein [Candidatus Saccharimonadales bacterium]